MIGGLIMNRPFALIGFVYLAVQAVSIYFGASLAFALSGCFAILFIITLFITKLRIAKVIPIACLVAAIVLSAYGGYHIWKIEPLTEIANTDAEITAVLCELPYENNGKFYYTLRVDEIKISDKENVPNPGKIVLSVRNALDIDSYGKITCKVHLYQSYGSDDGFTFRQSDYAKGIGMRAYMYEYQGYSIMPTVEKPPYYYALQARKAMMDSIDRLLSKKEAGIMKAVLLGDKTGLSENMKSDFSQAGVYHLLVVSGLHMTIMFQVLLKLLKFCKVPHKISCIVTMFGVLCFMAITGFTPSVMRSGLMSLLFLIAMLFGRKPDSLNSLGIAAFLLCAINPYAAADKGFLLSVTSALSLILLSNPIKRFFLNKTRKIKSCRGLMIRVVSSVSSSLAVSTGTLPIFIMGFTTIPIIGFISNLFMIFPTTMLLPITALAALFEAIPTLGFMAKPFALIGGLIAKYLIFAAHWLAKMPFATIASDYDFVMLWLAMTMILFATAIFIVKRRILLRTVLVLSFILLVTGILSYQLSSHSTIRISVLDVEDGISVVVTDNRQTAIIGCSGYSSLNTYRYLQGHGIRSIDYMQSISDETKEYQNLVNISERLYVKHMMLPNEPYFATDLAKSLVKVEEISYYEKNANIMFSDSVEIALHEMLDVSYTLLKVKDISVLILSSEQDLTKLNIDINQIDLIISDSVPQNVEYLQSFLTILSMDEQSMANSAHILEDANVQMYATAGRGDLHIDIKGERTLVLRRDSGG